MTNVRPRQFTRRSSGAEQTNILKLSVLRREIVDMEKKETNWLGRFYLFEYHVLDMLDILKQLKHLVKFWQLTRNSDSWFACDSELFFSIVDLPNFSGGMLSSGATNHWKPQRFFGKRSGSWQVFSPYKSFGRKVFGYWNGKNLAFLIQFMYSTFDREIRAYGWKARPWCGRSFGSISLDDKGEIWKTAFHKISHPVQVRADRMFISWCNGIKSFH